MMNLTIQEIAACCGGTLTLQGEGADGGTCVSSVAIDSREAQEGGVFIAVIGERADGHRFVPSVFARGAALAVVQKTPERVEAEHGVPAARWGSYILVEDTLRALRDIAEYYRKKLPVKVVGITGSSGKTSTKELTASVLAEKYRCVKTEGNLNNEIGVPLTLLSIRPEHEVAVVEMGISDFGEMHRLSKMARPDVCVITNIGQSHLKDLKTRDGILKAKSEIFDFMAEDGQVCLNGEDDKLCGIGEVKGRKPHFFGLGGSPGQEAAARDIVGRGLWGSDAVIAGIPVHIPLPGEHMVLNAAAAVCVAGLLGLDAEEIAAGLAKARPVGGRDNIVRLPRHTLIDGCYNANPASMKAAIDLLALADTEKVAILGDMLNLGEDSRMLHGQTGAYAARAGVHRIICVGEESREMYREAQAAVRDGQQAFYFPDRESLLEALASEEGRLAPEGSSVLVKASHGMEFIQVCDFFRGGGASGASSDLSRNCP